MHYRLKFMFTNHCTHVIGSLALKFITRNVWSTASDISRCAFEPNCVNFMAVICDGELFRSAGRRRVPPRDSRLLSADDSLPIESIIRFKYFSSSPAPFDMIFGDHIAAAPHPRLACCCRAATECAFCLAAHTQPQPAQRPA